MKENEYIVAQTQCGIFWYMDYDPAPDNCEDEYWRLGIEDLDGNIDWGSWVDRDGNSVENPEDEN